MTMENLCSCCYCKNICNVKITRLFAGFPLLNHSSMSINFDLMPTMKSGQIEHITKKIYFTKLQISYFHKLRFGHN